MGSKAPKYLRVRDAILADIRRGRLNPGDRLPTRNDLMRSHKVSRSTVEAALGELIRSSVLSTSKRGGTVVTDSPPSLRVAIISNISEEDLKANRGEPHGTLAISQILSGSPNSRLTFLTADSLAENTHKLATYDVIIWIQPDDASMQSLSQFGSKTLIVNRYPETISFVSTNHRAAVRELATYAFEKAGVNCQAFYIEHERNGTSFVQDERREGFIEACASLGLFYRICEAPASHEKAMKALSRLSFDKKQKIVIVSGTCIFSGAVLLTAEKYGFTLNKDFFYADFDNEHSLARMGRQMTTVIQNYSEMGKAVVKALDLIATGEQASIYVPHHIEKGF